MLAITLTAPPQCSQVHAQSALLGDIGSEFEFALQEGSKQVMKLLGIATTINEQAAPVQFLQLRSSVGVVAQLTGLLSRDTG
jgi:hypothetical protein